MNVDELFNKWASMVHKEDSGDFWINKENFAKAIAEIISSPVEPVVMPNEVLGGGSLHLAKQIREHLNSVGYDLDPTTEKLIKQVIDIESQRFVKITELLIKSRE